MTQDQEARWQSLVKIANRRCLAVTGCLPGYTQMLRRGCVSAFFRLFCTTYLASFAALGATSWQPVALAAASGLFIDIMRNLLAPECRNTPRSMLDMADVKVFDLSTHKEIVRHRMRLLKYLWISWVTFVTVFAVAVPPREDVTLSWATWWSAPLADLLANVSRVVRLFPAELSSHGYPHRAQVVALFYSVNIVFLLLTMVAMCSGVVYYTAIASANHFQSGNSPIATLPKFWAALAAASAWALAAYFLGSNLSWIRWQGTAIADGWRLSSENLSFVWFFICLFNTSVASMVFYAGLTAVRMLEWRD